MSLRFKSDWVLLFSSAMQTGGLSEQLERSSKLTHPKNIPHQALGRVRRPRALSHNCPPELEREDAGRINSTISEGLRDTGNAQHFRTHQGDRWTDATVTEPDLEDPLTDRRDTRTWRSAGVVNLRGLWGADEQTFGLDQGGAGEGLGESWRSGQLCQAAQPSTGGQGADVWPEERVAGISPQQFSWSHGLWQTCLSSDPGQLRTDTLPGLWLTLHSSSLRRDVKQEESVTVPLEQLSPVSQDSSRGSVSYWVILLPGRTDGQDENSAPFLLDCVGQTGG
ncbi:hypothetical protein AAFF_G00390520 [Aldrovandia affinis]|uniref:Uncharacterized protein n=1 Tax=Aldrovandia affinis TaxID=143900 RepID=A0AAD7SEM9_9TELE|nr:hypothetical protein AAFF_G00390520 [Aldrovandia affinis]